MFTKEQIEELEAPLSRDVVSTRSQAGRNLSYIEGWHAIAEANRIFGFGNWDRETVYCREVSRVDNAGKSGDLWKVGYEAEVRIVVRGPERDTVARTGTGLGSGISKDLFEAIEGAAKEAETDAMKRALMTFGNPFGLALYDKTQKNVGTKPKSAAQLKKDGAWEKITSKIDAAEDTTHLDLIMKEIAPEVKGWNETYKRELREHCSKKRSELEIKDQLGDTNVMAAG